jgi:hypothetical protein
MSLLLPPLKHSMPLMLLKSTLLSQIRPTKRMPLMPRLPVWKTKILMRIANLKMKRRKSDF